MADTQTQSGAGWNATARGTQDTKQNAWIVEYAPLVVRRPVPVAEDAGTGKLNFKRFRSKNAVNAARKSQIQSSLDKERLESVMQNGAELLSQHQQELDARRREEATFHSLGTTQMWKSQAAGKQAPAPKLRRRQAADASEIMARIASERKASTRNKRPRSNAGGVNQGMSTARASLASTPELDETQAMPATGPSSNPQSQRGGGPPTKKQKQSNRRRAATFVVD